MACRWRDETTFIRESVAGGSKTLNRVRWGSACVFILSCEPISYGLFQGIDIYIL